MITIQSSDQNKGAQYNLNNENIIEYLKDMNTVFISARISLW